MALGSRGSKDSYGIVFSALLDAIEEVAGFLLRSKDISVFEELGSINLYGVEKFTLLFSTWAFPREFI